mgnify:FL=1
MPAQAKTSGYAILSGILNGQAEEVAAAYKRAGFMLTARDELGEWTTLVLKRS